MKPLSFYFDNKSLYHLYLFQLAKHTQKTIQFDNIKYLETTLKMKRINVYSVSLRGRKIYIFGLDTKNGEVRHYVFTQVTNVIKIEDHTKFDLPNPDFVANFYSDSIDVFEGHTPKKVILKLNPKSENYLTKEYFHKSQKVIRNE